MLLLSKKSGSKNNEKSFSQESFLKEMQFADQSWV